MLQVVADAAEQLADQLGSAGGQSVDRVALLAQGTKDVQRRRRGVQADAVADPAIAGRVVGQHQRHPFFRVWLARQLGPAPRQFGDEIHALVVGEIADHVALAAFAAPGQALETDRPGDDASVQLRQRHVHGQVARPQALRVVQPERAVVQRADRLQHRHVATERTQLGRLRIGLGETGGIDDQRGVAALQPVFHLRQAGAFLEAGQRNPTTGRPACQSARQCSRVASACRGWNSATRGSACGSRQA